MARSRLDLQALLEALPGVTKAYIQPPTSGLVAPYIIYEPSSDDTEHADNVLYHLKKGYTVIVVDRDPDSLIPDMVRALPYCSFDRYYVSDGLHHFAFQLFF